MSEESAFFSRLDALDERLGMLEMFEGLTENTNPGVPAASILEEDGTIRRARISEYIRWQTAHPKASQIVQDFVRDSRVSTVFLGIGSMRRADEELFFETMVFEGYYDGVQYRYPDKATALEGHAAILKLVLDADDEISRLMEKVDGHDRLGNVPRAGV